MARTEVKVGKVVIRTPVSCSYNAYWRADARTRLEEPHDGTRTWAHISYDESAIGHLETFAGQPWHVRHGWRRPDGIRVRVAEAGQPFHVAARKAAEVVQGWIDDGRARRSPLLYKPRWMRPWEVAA